MKRLVPIVCLFALATIACGKEASIVPVVSVATPSATPESTAQVTYEPFVTASPTVQPLITPTPTPAPLASPTTTPAAATTPPSTVFPSHTPTPDNQPPDAYMRGHVPNETKGLITYYDWPTGSNGKFTSYKNPSVNPSNSMSVTKGQILGIKFTRNGKPSNIFAGYRTTPDRTNDTPIPITDENPAIIQANFPSGTVWVDVETFWGQAEVDYAFKLNVS
jgi:hypothetical protein